jgi:hypothetical protein
MKNIFYLNNKNMNIPLPSEVTNFWKNATAEQFEPIEQWLRAYNARETWQAEEVGCFYAGEEKYPLMLTSNKDN